MARRRARLTGRSVNAIPRAAGPEWPCLQLSIDSPEIAASQIHATPHLPRVEHQQPPSEIRAALPLPAPRMEEVQPYSLQQRDILRRHPKLSERQAPRRTRSRKHANVCSAQADL